ncbi:MAG: hypothetical protein ACI9VR_005308 [Cognaticolwellia sp.]
MNLRKALLLAPLLLLATPAMGRGGKEVELVGSNVDEETYSISARRGTSGVAERGHLELRIQSKQGYTLDNEYDIAVKMKGPAKHLEWGQKKLDRDDGQLFSDGTEFRVKIPFRGARIGEYPAKGKVSFRVCREDGCKRVRRSFETAVVVH